ncbi:MAG: hypothetical protein AB7G71_01180 [Burkholderiales bacterium]
MPSAVLSAGRGPAATVLLALAAAVLAGASPAGHGASAQVSVEVPEGKTRSVRLRRLPREAVVAVSVRSSAALQVALVSAAQLKSQDPQALFRGALERRLTFQVVIQDAGDYYLVLDNRAGKAAVKVTATIRARKGAAAPRPAPKPPGSARERLNAT